MGVLFACPRCHGDLVANAGRLTCASCRAAFPTVAGIPVFCESDAFYEGKWTGPDRSAGSLRNWLVRKERFFMRRLAGAKGPLLDLGCGGGWQLLARARETVGIDVSRSSLEAARTIYSQVAAADLRELPFPDETFALVVSSDVLGHVAIEDKDRVLAEIHRVLRKGGRTLHYVEADGQDPLSRFEKRYPELYRKYVTAPEGHIGLEKASKTAERFRRHGFVPVKEIPCYKGLLYVNRVLQHLDNDYRERSKLASASVYFCRLLTRIKAAESLANVAVTFAMEVVDRICPPDWAGGVLLEYSKQD